MNRFLSNLKSRAQKFANNIEGVLPWWAEMLLLWPAMVLYITVTVFIITGAVVLMFLSFIPAWLFGWPWDPIDDMIPKHMRHPPTVETSPVEMPPTVNTDEEDVALILRAHRWPCDGPGCVELSEVVAPLVSHARAMGIEPVVMAGLVMVENPWLDNKAVSHAGAVGLAQIMPNYWDGAFPECGDLYSVEGNLCYGSKILAHYLGVYTTKDRALLAYNGCQPHWSSCNWYSGAVMARGGLGR